MNNKMNKVRVMNLIKMANRGGTIPRSGGSFGFFCCIAFFSSLNIKLVYFSGLNIKLVVLKWNIVTKNESKISIPVPIIRQKQKYAHQCGYAPDFADENNFQEF